MSISDADMAYWPQAIADRLCVYQLPEREYSEYRARVNLKRVAAFVEQIPTELHPVAWTMLEKFQMLDLYLLISAWAHLPDDVDTIALPLTTTSGESAQLMSYFVSKRGVEVWSLERAASVNRRPVWFFDDFLMSGKQASTAVHQMLGKPFELNEHLARRLTAPEEQWLRKANITFRFACGTRQGKQQLRNVLEAEGIEGGIEIMHEAPSLAHLGHSADDPMYVALCEFLGEVGFALNWTNPSRKLNPDKWNVEKCRADAMGYGGMSLLTASFYGVPTATITAIWKHGEYRDKPWMPLLPRSV